MTCPHCGADASAGQKFCPKCSRLVDSPLLKVKQQIDAAREEIRRDLNAARTVRFSPPPPPPTHQPLPRPQYHVKVATPDYTQAPTPAKYAPHPSQTPGLTPPLPEVPRETILRSQNKRQRKKQRDEGITRTQHTDTTHRFDPSAAAKKAAEEAKAAAAAGAVPERFKRPMSYSILAVLDVFGAIAMFYIAIQLTLTHPEPRTPIVEFSRILAGATAFLFVITAFGMSKLHPFGRFFQRLLLLPAAFWVPIGTIYAIGSWLYLGSSTTKLYFSGRSPRSLNAKELASWRTFEKAAPVFAFLLFAFGFAPALGYTMFMSRTLPMVFEEAARMFPEAFNQLTETPALEGGAASPGAVAAVEAAPTGDPASVAVSEIRTMQRAQAVYSGLNEGYYDRLECVLAPAKCIRNNDGRNNAVLLEPRFKEIERNEYLYQLYLFGPPAVRSDTASPTSMRGYAYRAVPSSGVGTGYCGDETGMVCSFDAATFASDRGNGGRCPNVCDLVQP